MTLTAHESTLARHAAWIAMVFRPHPKGLTAMRFAPLFHDHAVLQRDLSIPIWGTAGAEQDVTVSLAGTTVRATAGPDGAWLVRFPALPAGGPHELVARAASGEAIARDVLIGDVWVCSGQSNMEWKLSETNQMGSAAENAFPSIRVLTVSTPARHGRQTAIDGRWTLATHASLRQFSAVGGWFGKELHRNLGVPIGLINNAWGGTRVQAWISREGLMQDPGGRDDVTTYESRIFLPSGTQGPEFTSFDDWVNRGAPKDSGNAGLGKGWATSAFSDQDWRTMTLPGAWQNNGHPGSGVFWFRRTVAVPADWSGRDLDLRLGAIDKHDDTYVNGERVGGLSWEQGPSTWNTLREYTIPARLIGRDGRVTIAIRARSHVYHGGLIGPITEMRLHPRGADEHAIDLSGKWQYTIEQDWGVQTPPAMLLGVGNANSPYTLFDSRLSPLIPYGIRGAIWYQGESNAHEAQVYRRLLPLMIRDWRRAWGQGDFPFVQVQLANYKTDSGVPGRSEWAELREAQTATLAEPQTGMAVAIDIGDAADIHPRNKRSVGERLARWALSQHYGTGGLPSGPLFTRMTSETAGRLRCHFNYADGLKTSDTAAPKRVCIAGSDKTFVWAETRIEGETLIAWHPTIAKPVAVRYAWSDNPVGCNLVNSAGLPASPFRSDTWDG